MAQVLRELWNTISWAWHRMNLSSFHLHFCKFHTSCRIKGNIGVTIGYVFDTYHLSILDTLASGLELRRIPLPLVPRGDGTTEVTSHTHCHGIGIIRRRVFTLWSGNWGFGRWFLKSKHLQHCVRKRLKVSAGKFNSLVVKTGASCLMAIVIIAVLYLIILSTSMQLS